MKYRFDRSMGWTAEFGAVFLEISRQDWSHPRPGTLVVVAGTVRWERMVGRRGSLFLRRKGIIK